METSDKKISEELKEVEKQWAQAIVANDAEAIGRFMSDDWIMVSTEGGITGKEAFLSVIRSGDLTHDRMGLDDLSIRLYGNMALVTGHGISSGNYKGQYFSLHEWATDVFVRENGQWKCVHTMVTAATHSG